MTLSNKHILSGVAPVLPTYTIATLPAASAANTNVLVFVSDCANGSGGDGNVCVSNGTVWRRLDSGATAATS